MCLSEGYGDSTVASPDGKALRRRSKRDVVNESTNIDTLLR